MPWEQEMSLPAYGLSLVRQNFWYRYRRPVPAQPVEPLRRKNIKDYRI